MTRENTPNGRHYVSGSIVLEAQHKTTLDGTGQPQEQSAENSLNFKANDDQLEFNNRNLKANENYSSGLLFLGKFLLLHKTGISRFYAFHPSTKHLSYFLNHAL